VKRSAPNLAVLCEWARTSAILWFRAAIRFYNGLLSSNSATLKQALHAGLKLVPRDKTSWAFDILHAFEGLRGCDTYTQAILQGYSICHSDFTAELRFRMRKVWRDNADMTPQESDNKLVTHHYWFPCPLDLQADSRTHEQNGGDPLMPPRYLHVGLPKHVKRNVSRFRLREHTLSVKCPIWHGGNCLCYKCSCVAVQYEVHIPFHCHTHLCALSERCIRSSPFLSSSPFLWRTFTFCHLA